MKKILAFVLLSFCLSANAEERQFMRPAVANNATSAYSHSQLYNPADSGVRVIVDKIYVTGGAGFTLLGYGGSMFSGANFPESRGLAVHQIADPGSSGVNYSKAHARIYTGSPIDAGQWGFYSSGPLVVGEGVILEPGNSVVIRGVSTNSQTNVTFLWHEEAIGE